MMSDFDFFKNKRVLVTGHTGFKGSWMCEVLLQLGAKVTGYALDPPTTPSLYVLNHLNERMDSVIGDVRDFKKMQGVFRRVQPEIVIHLAAQPLVRESYRNPVGTYEINVMGTVYVLECVRETPSVRSFLNVTTDKVYLNKEWEWGYRENEEINGFDPYSNSKSCSELVTSCYRNSFFENGNVAVSTARAGNVIGGGDFSTDRIIPDCVRAALGGEKILIRNPYSIRPYQHVLEPVMVYLRIAMKQFRDGIYAGNYNVGPNEDDCITTGKLVELFCASWEKQVGRKVESVYQQDGGPHEANFLKLDCSKLKNMFQWKPIWSIEETMERTVEWYAAYKNNEDVQKVMEKQMKEIKKLMFE